MNPETLTPDKAVQGSECETSQISEGASRQLEQVMQLAQQAQEHAFVVTTEHGLHARPATRIVNLLKENYAGEVSMSYQRYNPKTCMLEHRKGNEVDPRSVLELMSAALPQRSIVYFRFQNGEPSKELVDAIREALDDYYPALF